MLTFSAPSHLTNVSFSKPCASTLEASTESLPRTTFHQRKLQFKPADCRPPAEISWPFTQTVSGSARSPCLSRNPVSRSRLYKQIQLVQPAPQFYFPQLSLRVYVMVYGMRGNLREFDQNPHYNIVRKRIRFDSLAFQCRNCLRMISYSALSLLLHLWLSSGWCKFHRPFTDWKAFTTPLTRHSILQLSVFWNACMVRILLDTSPPFSEAELLNHIVAM